MKKTLVFCAIAAVAMLTACSANKRAQLSSDLDNAGDQFVEDTKGLGKSIKKGGHNVVKGTKSAVKSVGKEIGKMGEQIEKDFY